MSDVLDLYSNTEACWKALCEASKPARYLGLVDADAFDDRRNPPPVLFHPYPTEELWHKVVADKPYVATSLTLPTVRVNRPDSSQRYFLELWAEKSTLNDVLLPICRKLGVNLITGVGEMSIPAAQEFVKRVAHHDGPGRLFYLSDFDPGGKSMPVALSRKVEFYVRKSGLALDVRTFSVALTAEQVRLFKLPRAPIKATESRRDTFERRHGSGATELDALEALHPGALGDLVFAALSQYRDDGLDARVDEAFAEYRGRIGDLVHAGRRRHAEEIELARSELMVIEELARAWEARHGPLWERLVRELRQGCAQLPEFEMPEAEYVLEDDNALYDSERDYWEQIDAYWQFKEGNDG